MPRINGEKLREIREGKVLSHRDLAKRANMSPMTILNPESGKVEAQRRTVRKLAEALELNPAKLVE